MRNSLFSRVSGQYPLIAFGATLLVLITIMAARSVLVAIAGNHTADVTHSIVGIVDFNLAALTSAASLMVLSGLWRLDPETAYGQLALRCVFALLAGINLAAWGMALWLP